MRSANSSGRPPQTSRSGGLDLAAEAIAAGLVDECHLFVSPVIVGGGKRALPAGGLVHLDLLVERRSESGVVYLRYRVRP
jgi:dihydrofolate reductase